MDESKVTGVLEAAVAVARQAVEPLQPEWEARREIAKTLISLASATLVFTITFAPSMIRPNTALSWRYTVIACWLAFICSLVLSLGSLWFSMGLASLPVLMMQLDAAAKEAVRTSRPDPMLLPFLKAFGRVGRQEVIALWLLRASVASFGVALIAFTLIGVRQLLH